MTECTIIPFPCANLAPDEAKRFERLRFETIVANAYRLPSLTTPAHEDALREAILRTDKSASRILRLPGRFGGVAAGVAVKSYHDSQRPHDTRIAVLSAIAKGARSNEQVCAVTRRSGYAVQKTIGDMIVDGLVERKREKNTTALKLTPRGAGVLAAAADARFRGQ